MSGRGMLQLAGVALAILAVLLLARGVGLRWDPFDLQGRRLDAARARAEQAGAEHRAAVAARDGERQITEALARTHQTEAALARATATAIQQARQADDADQALAPDRVRRLHEHDRRLCEHAPDLCAAAGPADPAG